MILAYLNYLCKAWLTMMQFLFYYVDASTQQQDFETIN